MRLLTKAHLTSISHSLSLKEGSVMLFRMLTQAYLTFGTIVAQLESIYSGDRVRTYWVHKPDNFDIAKKYPVVVALHGGSRISENLDGVAMGADTRLSQRVRGIKFSADVSTVLSPWIHHLLKSIYSDISFIRMELGAYGQDRVTPMCRSRPICNSYLTCSIIC